MPFVLWSHSKPEVLWAQWWSRGPTALNTKKGKHLCKRMKKKKKEEISFELLSFHAWKTPKQSFTAAEWLGSQCKADLLFLVFFSEPTGSAERRASLSGIHFPTRNGSTITLGIVKLHCWSLQLVSVFLSALWLSATRLSKKSQLLQGKARLFAQTCTRWKN